MEDNSVNVLQRLLNKITYHRYKNMDWLYLSVYGNISERGMNIFIDFYKDFGYSKYWANIIIGNFCQHQEMTPKFMKRNRKYLNMRILKQRYNM